MQIIRTMAILIVSVVLFAAGTVGAQPSGSPASDQDRAVPEKALRVSGGEVYKAKEAGQVASRLGLEGKDKERFLKTLARHKENKKGAKQKLKGLMASLREGMKKGAPDKEISSLLDKVNDAYDRLDAIRKSERQDLGNILTPRQHAKLLLMSVRGRR